MEYDIIIVGAGPAGLSTGLHLAQLAPELLSSALVLEQAHHPRPKLCAGGVLSGAEACLHGLGLDMSAVPSVPVCEIQLAFEGRVATIRREPVAFRTVRRDQFDAWLADQARQRGIAIQEGVRVRAVHVLEEGVRVETEQGNYHARVVVGADGAKGIVRRAVDQDRGPQVARLLEVRVPGRGWDAGDRPAQSAV